MEQDVLLAKDMYWKLLSAFLESGVYSEEDIEGKNFLLIGGLIFDSSRMADGDSLARLILEKYFIPRKAGVCHRIDEFVQFSDEKGRASSNLQYFLEDQKTTYDHVLFIEGLERASCVSQAVGTLNAALKTGGTLFVLCRTPMMQDARSMLRSVEDVWRYRLADLCEMFPEPGFRLRTTVSCNPEYIVAAQFQKLQENHFPSGSARYFSVAARCQVTEDEGRHLGYFSQFHELETVGAEELGDKCSIAHNYLRKYEFLLRDMKNKAFNLLELGVFTGASERMWKKYFPYAQIYGVDIDPDCRQYEERNIRIVIMDLAQRSNLQKLRELHPHVIIDDGSHLWSHQIMALQELFPALPSGGIYIVEDMETSLNTGQYPGYSDAPISGYDFCERIVRVTASKEPEPETDEFSETVNAIGMRVEMALVMKGSVALVKR